MPPRKFVEALAKKVISELKPYCKKIHIAGSILRGEKIDHEDIDIALIPKDRLKLEEFMKTKGKFLQGGEHESTWNIAGVDVELYYTTEEEWGSEMLAYSSEKGPAIGLRMIAKRMGYKLNNHGLWKDGKRIAGRTEKEIYKALGRKWKKPEDR